MGIEAIALGATQITAVAAMGLFLWHVFGRRFDAIDARLDKVDDRFDKVDDRFARFEADVSARFDQSEAEVNARFDRSEAEASAKFERFEADVDAKLDRFETSIGGRFSALEAKVDDLAKDHQSLARELSEFRGEIARGGRPRALDGCMRVLPTGPIDVRPTPGAHGTGPSLPVYFGRGHP